MKTRKKISKKRTQKSRTKSITARIRSTLRSPKNHFAELAPLIEISFTDLVTGEKRKQKFPRNKNKKNENMWVLLWNDETDELIGIKRGHTADITNHIPEKEYKSTRAYKIYKAFNGFEIPHITLSSIDVPIKWEEVGKAEHIVYHSDKNNKGDFYDYIHPFGDNGYIQIKDHGVKFYYDRVNKIFKLSGGRLTVNDRGIVY